MKPKLVPRIVGKVERGQIRVLDLLQVAIDRDFEECVLVGVKGNEYEVLATPTMSVLKVVGALEMAKSDIVLAAE